MSNAFVDLVTRYRRRGLLVDTNVYLLHLIGSYDRTLIGQFKRTRDRFVPDDYDVVASFVALFDPVVTVPHVLAEVSNLARSLSDPKRRDVFLELAAAISVLQEQPIPSAAAASRPEFPEVGLADAAILEVAAHRFLVLTDDLALSRHLERAGADVVNFNHIRVSGWRP